MLGPAGLLVPTEREKAMASYELSPTAVRKARDLIGAHQYLLDSD